MVKVNIKVGGCVKVCIKRVKISHSRNRSENRFLAAFWIRENVAFPKFWRMIAAYLFCISYFKFMFGCLVQYTSHTGTCKN